MGLRVALQQAVVDEGVPPAGDVVAVAGVEDDHEHGEGQPVGRARCAGGVCAGTSGHRSRPAVEPGGDERPVQQEAGQHEEQRHAHVGAGEPRPERLVPAHEPRLQAHVAQQDAQGGDGPEPVEARELPAGRAQPARRVGGRARALARRPPLGPGTPTPAARALGGVVLVRFRRSLSEPLPRGGAKSVARRRIPAPGARARAPARPPPEPGCGAAPSMPASIVTPAGIMSASSAGSRNRVVP